MPRITRRESAALMNSLTAGVVPRIGLRHIAVGRQKEVNALLQDLSTIANGGAAFRLICGRYGSGKSFLLQLIRINAMERKYVVADADLSMERRLFGSKGNSVSTYRELMQHLAVSVRPDGDGGVLDTILQKWIDGIHTAVTSQEGLEPGDPAFAEAARRKIAEVLAKTAEMAGGFSFNRVIKAYWQARMINDETLMNAALRWLRGEYATKTEAKHDLGVDQIIDDNNWYDFLKLFAMFVHNAGYRGLVIFLDEGVTLYKIVSKVSRDNNYEKLLTIFNDTMQGKARYIGIFLSGTPDFVLNEQRGLFSYEALRTRIAQTRFATQGYMDNSGPVIQLAQLTPEEIYILLERLCALHSAHFSYTCPLGERERIAFLGLLQSQIGADQWITTREVTRDFLGILNILYQNEGLTFDELLQGEVIHGIERDPEALSADEELEFAAYDV